MDNDLFQSIRRISMVAGSENIGAKVLFLAAAAAGVYLLRQWQRRRAERSIAGRGGGGRNPNAGLEEALLAEAPGTPPYGDTGTPLLEERAPFAEGRARAAESPTLEQPGTPRGHQDDAPAAMPAGIALFSDFMGAGQEPEAKLEPQNQPHQADLDAGSSTRSSHGMAAAPTAPVPLVELPPRAAEAVSVALPPAKADVSPFGGYPPMPPGMESPAAPGALPTHRDHSGGDVWAEIPRGVGQGVHIDRSHTMRSAASDRRLPRVEEEEMQPMASTGACVRLALKLDVVAGPCSETSYVTGEDTAVVSVGRAGDNHLVLHDAEVSGRHITISWSPMGKCWQVADLGSLNGSLLNGESITGGKASPAPSTSLGSAGSATANGSGAGGARARGENFRLSTDDILQLGSATRLKVSVFPREMLPENSNERAVSLSLGSFPRSLTMPKHRVPSFSSLLSPKINSSPSKHAVVAAASDELRLECCIASATGRDHARKGETIEDVASAECPLRGSETALGGSTAGLFCVFDGHCGRGAADAASAVLPEEVSARLPVVKDVMEAGSEGAGAHGALHAAFLATDKRIAAEEGCTATAVLAWSGAGGAVHLQAANVGDSAALLIDPGSGSWKVLTEDHRLTNPAERERLARTGIPLSGTTRRLYGLNLARALGDRFLKDEDLGLSAEPHVSDVATLPLDQGALVLVASDGVWDVLDFAKVASLASATDRETEGDAVDVAGAVVSAAKKAGTRDDVTALVVRVWPQEEWALRSPTANLDDGRHARFEL